MTKTPIDSAPRDKPKTRLGHANLVVAAIEPTLEFIQTAIPEWQVRGQGRMEWHGKPRRWLHVGDDDYFLTLNDDGEGGNRDLTGHATGLAHLAFVDDLDGVVERSHLDKAEEAKFAV